MAEAQLSGQTGARMQTAVQSLVASLMICVAISYGCQTTERAQQRQWIQVPIADLSNVQGKWDGLMRAVPHQRRDDWVTVAIAPDGRYEFSSLRTIGVFSGHGAFALEEGKLFSKSERGTVEAVLYEAGGQRMLKAKGRAADGTEYTAEVKPAKAR
jgi:hypothetical protein